MNICILLPSEQCNTQFILKDISRQYPKAAIMFEFVEKIDSEYIRHIIDKNMPNILIIDTKIEWDWRDYISQNNCIILVQEINYTSEFPMRDLRDDIKLAKSIKTQNSKIKKKQERKRNEWFKSK